MLEKKEETANDQPIKVNTDFPVHTMKDDLETMGQSKMPNRSIANETIKQISEKPAVNNLPPNKTPFDNSRFENFKIDNVKIDNIKKEATRPIETQSSPFFKQEGWDKSATEQKESMAEDSGEKKGLSRSIIWGIIIFVVLAAGAGGYYFWITRINVDMAENQPELTIPEPIAPETPTAPEMPAEPEFSTDKPNYLMISDSSLPIANYISEYAAKVLDANIDVPVEFILTDEENNNLSLQDFAQNLGINLPDSLKKLMETTFSLYLYNDQGSVRTGLTLYEIGGTTPTLQSAVLKEEPNLAKYFQPILPESTEIPANVVFSASDYAGNKIKFVNFMPDGKLSIDYAFKNQQWLIGTSKAMMRSMLDSIGKSYQPIN